jgi:hypothetical protein
MNPAMVLRLSVGAGMLDVPVFRLPFAVASDGAAPVGGFFTTKQGEFGILIDARLDEEHAKAFVTDEIRKAAPAIRDLAMQRGRLAPAHPSPRSLS